MRIHLFIFQTSTIGRFSYLPLDYYLSTYYSGPSFVLGYLCMSYFLCLFIIFVGCNLDLEEKWAFHTSPIAFEPYSKPKVKSQSWLPKYHIGDEKTGLNNDKSKPTILSNKKAN